MKDNMQAHIFAIAMLQAHSQGGLPVSPEYMSRLYFDYVEALEKERAKRESKPEPEPTDFTLDIAYLAIGADRSWRELVDATGETPEAFDGLGQDRVIGDVISAAPLLADEWRRVAVTWDGAVWVYEVTEELGAWIVRSWASEGRMPSSARIIEQIRTLIREAQQ